MLDKGVNRLGPTTRHVLLTLSMHMSLTGDDARPSVRTLAMETGLGRRSVMRHLAIAARGGWIERYVGGAGQAWKHHEYRATMPDASPEVGTCRDR